MAVMAIPQDIMSKTPTSGGSATRKVSHNERRNSRRCKITQLMHIRPSDPERDHFDDMRGTLSVSRSGVFFHSSESKYQIGMRLFVSMPYSQDAAATNREYLAEVVRRDVLTTGMYGIGIKILMELGLQQNNSYRSGKQLK